MDGVTLELPISQDLTVKSLEKAVKLSSGFLQKRTQPTVKGCTVKVDYQTEVIEQTANSRYKSYQDDYQELLIKI